MSLEARMQYMHRILVSLIVIAAAGCATPRAAEIARPAAETVPAEPQAAQQSAVPAEQQLPAAAQTALPERETKVPALPGEAPRGTTDTGMEHEPAVGPAATAPVPPEPEIREKLSEPSLRHDAAPPAPLTTAKKETPSTSSARQRARAPRETAVPDHRLAPLAELAADNDEKMLHVFVGMYRKTVDKIMGTDHNPYRRRTINGTDGQAYEVLFYLTREPRQGKPVTERMLTPVIFKQGKVAAMGHYQLKKLNRTGTLDRQKLASAPPR